MDPVSLDLAFLVFQMMGVAVALIGVMTLVIVIIVVTAKILTKRTPKGVIE